MNDLLNHLEQGLELSPLEIEALVEVLTSEGDDTRKLQLLKTYANKGETASELAALVVAFRKRALPLAPLLGDLQDRLLDLCGTGGDRLHLFNISTAASFVVAAAGVPVVKHGNRGVSSKSGTADVLEVLGVRIDASPEQAAEALRRNHFTFLFAQKFHPAFKHIAPTRRQLASEGIVSVFNVLGPLLNPAEPRRQLIGVFDPLRAPRIAQSLALLGHLQAWVVHGLTGTGAGMDEISVCGPTEVHAVKDGEVQTFELQPEDFGFSAVPLEDLAGGDAAQNAVTMRRILEGSREGSDDSIAKAVIANAAGALIVAGLTESVEEAAEIATRMLREGLALEVLEKAIAMHQTD